jgi:hypothetical protein
MPPKPYFIRVLDAFAVENMRRFASRGVGEFSQ